MISFIKNSIAWSFAITTGLFTFVPEASFNSISWVSQENLSQCNLLAGFHASEVNIVLSRCLCFLAIWIIVSLLYALCLLCRKKIIINGSNYSICVEYGDIFETADCKRIISFDECFTTKVGSGIAEVKPSSICGQYLTKHPDLNIQQLIETAQVLPARGKSKHQQRLRYESGTIIPNGDDLLMAFAKLDERGKGRFFTRDEYVHCLDKLWKEIECYYCEMDVCIPILGAGITSFEGGDGSSLSQQELLDIIIRSYILSSHKIKAPHKLRIVCKPTNGFSINRISSC